MAHPRQPSARLAEHHRRISPSSAARLCQGSYGSRDARDGYVDVSAEAERTRRALEKAHATTLRRKGRLLELHRRIAAAESEERDAAKAAAKAQLALDRVIGTATVGASAGPTPSKRRQCQLAVAMSRGRSLLGRQCPVHGFFTTRKIRVKTGGRGGRKSLRFPDVSQKNAVFPAEASVNKTYVVRNGPKLLAGSAEGRPGPRFGHGPESSPRSGPRHSLIANPSGGTGGAPPHKKAARRQP